MIALNRFTYNGYSSRDFDLICDLAFDSDSDNTETFLNREAIASEVYNGTLKRTHNYKYSEVFAPSFTLIKNNFEDFTTDEVRKILAWLTSSFTPKFLTAYEDDSEVISFEILGSPTEIETYKLGNGRIVGIMFTFESCAPYAFSDVQTVTKDITTPQTFTITCNSDELGAMVYPKVTIIHKLTDSLIVKADHAMNYNEDHILGTVYEYGGTYYYISKDEKDDQGNNKLIITSTKPTDWSTTGVLIENIVKNPKTGEVIQNFKTIIANDIAQETVILDGANRVISSSRESRIFADDFNWNWMPLLPGDNNIKVTGSCTVKLEWREPRKVGV